jgi:3'-phosphoadenosine 5'-phosphosulfate sulfotransferase (PAPS reductase)/FAD synthetase
LNGIHIIFISNGILKTFNFEEVISSHENIINLEMSNISEETMTLLPCDMFSPFTDAKKVLLNIKDFDIGSYDYYVIAFSGGKDSMACILWLLEQGINNNKIELWHHCIDADVPFMDWPITRDYVHAVAKELNLPLYYSWKVGGFLGEMLRENSLTKPTQFESPEGVKQIGGIRGKVNTRLKFPMVSTDMQKRWCSSYLKIGVGEAAIINQKRFREKRTLFITGERAEESPNRARYPMFEMYRADARESKYHRHVDVYRPVHKYSQKQIWNLLKQWRINAHPCYHLGWGRCSCAGCIFSNANQWATLKQVSPQIFHDISLYEQKLQTIRKNISIEKLATSGRPYHAISKKYIQLINIDKFKDPIILKEWQEPAGSLGEQIGPT